MSYNIKGSRISYHLYYNFFYVSALVFDYDKMIGKVERKYEKYFICCFGGSSFY